MPTYTIEVRVKVWGETPREAYEDVKLALRNSKRQEIVYIDMETVATEADEPELVVEAHERA